MSKVKIGIQANLINHPLGGRFPRFDTRTTADVDATRAPLNGKPFRNKKMREIAKAEAFQETKGKRKGAWISYAPRENKEVVQQQKTYHKAKAEPMTPELEAQLANNIIANTERLKAKKMGTHVG